MSIPDRTQLVRGLTLTDTTALVVGTVIGTGVFIKSAIMAQDAGSPCSSWRPGSPQVCCLSPAR